MRGFLELGGRFSVLFSDAECQRHKDNASLQYIFKTVQVAAPCQERNRQRHRQSAGQHSEYTSFSCIWKNAAQKHRREDLIEISRAQCAVAAPCAKHKKCGRYGKK